MTMKDFNLIQQHHRDSDGSTVTDTITHALQAELDEYGVLKIYDKSSGDMLNEEPKKWNAEGQPVVDWVDVDDGITWYLGDNHHVGE